MKRVLYFVLILAAAAFLIIASQFRREWMEYIILVLIFIFIIYAAWQLAGCFSDD